MTHLHQLRWPVLLLLGAAGLFLLAGCGGGSSPTPSPDPTPVTLINPVEDATKPSSVAGTIFTMAESSPGEAYVIDQAYKAEITLSGLSDANQAVTLHTLSTLRGGYQFANVPPGTYTVTAQAHAAYDNTIILTGQVAGVRARGNIPTLMVNLLLGSPAQKATLLGTVTQNGQSVAGATVSLDVAAYTVDYLQGNKTDKTEVIISSTTDEDGKYLFSVPPGGIFYYVAAHSDSSMVTESPKVTELLPGQTQTIDLALNPAETPEFSELILDMVSVTLPQATAQASEQALMTRLAVARALHAPAEKMARLQKLVTTRKTTRGVNGFVENDLYWVLRSGDVGVRGFHVYRSYQEAGPFTYLGTSRDPYQFYFFDNDPQLEPGDRVYYTVTSYAANGQISAPSPRMAAFSMPSLVQLGPDDGRTVSRNLARLIWQAVPGAQSYLVLIFSAEPTFNAVPVREPNVYVNGETSEAITTLAPGTYWWTVAAYNATDPNYATAATFAPYRKVIVTE